MDKMRGRTCGLGHLELIQKAAAGSSGAGKPKYAMQKVIFSEYLGTKLEDH